MKDENKEIFGDIDAEDDESEQAADIFRAAVESGEISTLDDAIEHLELVRQKRDQAVELGMSGAKQRLDDRLEQAETDLDHLASTASDRRAEERAKTLRGLASGANTDVERLVASDDQDAPDPSSSGGTAQLSDSAPEDLEAKAARLSESADEAERLGLNAAAQDYRDRAHQLRDGRQ